MFRIFFSIFFLICVFHPAIGTAFPFPDDLSEESEKNEFYKLQINSHVMNFLNENRLRYFTGAWIKAQLPVSGEAELDVKTSYSYSWAEHHHYFRPYEWNLKFERPNGQWFFGRKQVEWSWADRFWKRGLWQPAYMDDTLRPQWAGLTGIFRNINYEKGQINLFGSFIFIPDFTPPFENKNGMLVSDNPWFISPPSGKIGSTNIVPVYRMTPPDLSDFLKLSIGGKLAYEGMYIAYAYKPMNKIRAKSQLSLRLDKKPVESHETGYLVETPIETVILQHHLLNGGLIWETSDQSVDSEQSVNYRLKTSITYNHPETHTSEDNTWIFFQPRKEIYASAKGEVQIKDSKEETLLHIGYTHLLHLQNEPKNLLSKTFPDIEKQFFQDDLFQFTRAVSTGISHNIKFDKNLSAKIKTRLIYHFLHEYFLFSFYASLTFEKAFSFFFSGDLLFSNFPFFIEQTKKDIGFYSNKSRIFGGLSYAF